MGPHPVLLRTLSRLCVLEFLLVVFEGTIYSIYIFFSSSGAYCFFLITLIFSTLILFLGVWLFAFKNVLCKPQVWSPEYCEVPWATQEQPLSIHSWVWFPSKNREIKRGRAGKEERGKKNFGILLVFLKFFSFSFCFCSHTWQHSGTTSDLALRACF